MLNENLLDIVKELIAAGADVNARDKNGETPLIRACVKENLGIFGALMAAGAANSDNVNNNNGKTPLIDACDLGQLDIVRALIHTGADVNAQDEYKNTPLTYTCSKRDHADIVRLLLEAGADANTAKSGVEMPLMCAANPSKFELFIGRGPSEKEYKAVRNKNRRGSMAFLKALIDAGADVNVRDDSGMSPLMWAANDAFSNTIQVLLDAGTDIDAKDFKGRTALDLSRYDNIRELLFNAQKKCRINKSKRSI